MKLHPHNGTVLCKLINKSQEFVVENGIAFNSQQMLIYEIIEIGILDKKYDFNIGDKIITNSIPTKLKINDKEIFWLIKQEYIAGKVI